MQEEKDKNSRKLKRDMMKLRQEGGNKIKERRRDRRGQGWWK